uniref:Uncharacterized protein n=1 Tax=Amphilophus citrinellus TaxID=61819 RepID=A0A3Q0T2N9_AMPCI
KNNGKWGLFVYFINLWVSFEPVICYFLDAFLIIYCIIVTGFFFREKVSYSTHFELVELTHILNTELERPNDADPYEVLDPSKRKVQVTSFADRLFNDHTFSGT